MAIINMIGGGGGLQSTDAILRVIAPAGSTVTISKGGVSKSDLGHENASDTSLYDYYFVIHASQFDSVNPWTATATLGTDVASDTVIIDTADEYDLELIYRVPAGFQEVEYIEGTGSQYLDTTIPCQFCWIDVSFMATAYQDGPFILTSASPSPRYNLVDIYSQNTRTFYNGTSSDRITYGTKLTLNTIASIQSGAKPGEQYVTVNGTRAAKTSTDSPTLTGYFSIFRQYGATSPCVYGRIYSLKIYDTNDHLIGDMIPCYRKADSVAGLWDRINQEFLTNKGSGTLVIGGDVN